ncbi:hypothetical protein OsJ_21857 [Oryza sativa Japonica Group]|uniref:Uncharacterized protein n=1 Tax=Oryza sativa subsp. japonica TaxID=39947 RepID=A3BD86_ORYSJ|nr:hypothetical protein OsJ_21857 [Oryza sativa Japonica Group]
MGYNELIPGLPEEVARECLIRVGFDQLPAVRRISRQWKAEVESPAYNRLRKAEGLARPALALVQARRELAEAGPAADKQSSAGGVPGNSYRMVLLDPAEGRWTPLPEVGGASGSLPLFCQVAAVDGGVEGRKRLVVVGGWDPETWAPTDSVLVYDFLTGAWRRGAAMPGPAPVVLRVRRRRREGVRRRWPRRGEERPSIGAGVRPGRRRVGRAPRHGGGARRAARALRRRQVPGRRRVPDAGAGAIRRLRRVVRPGDVHLVRRPRRLRRRRRVPENLQRRPRGRRPACTCSATGHLVARHGEISSAPAAWRPVAPVPEDARTAAAVSVIPDGRVVVIGSDCHGGDQTVYTLREEAGKPASWARAPAPPEFSGHVQAACLLEI